ncbi:MAG: hypothetical protein CME84_07825, partial [Henriciella sp.]|nr:hypothetical protein [Henriciella sp.]
MFHIHDQLLTRKGRPDEEQLRPGIEVQDSDGYAGLVRARLKAWRQALPNALSAHRFLGALCTALWCTDFR